MAQESKENAEQRSGISVPSRHRELEGFHKVLYDAVGELSPGLSEEAFSTLCSDAKFLELSQITLNFRDAAVEAEFQQHVAVRRRPILLLVFCFDVICYLFRMAAKFVRTDIALAELVRGIFPQLCNMMLLYTFLGLLNRRSRRLGDSAARQEEYMLTGIMTFAICSLLATINESNPQDYVYAAMFMISTTCFLKIQWLVGTSFMMLPLAVTHFWHRNANVLPTDAMVHLIVSWAVGGFMAYLSDTYRRQMFVNHRLAKVAAEKELQEAQARINVQQQLAAAQAQAAQRAISVAREKAANEAKSEFMSLMCHEVRTPLNGCLASAEMLLEMPLQEEQRELAKTIRVSGSILLSTVSNFLDFFKMEAGKQLDVVRTEITTKELVGDIHCIIAATIGKSSEVQLEKPNTNGVPDYVLGDPDRLRGILLNLYTNAAKFTRKGSIALRVRLASKDYRPRPAQDLGDGWFNTVAQGKASVRRGVTSSTGSSFDSEGSVSAAQSDTDRLIQPPHQSPFSQAPPSTDPAVPAAESDQWLVFEVTDTGFGISQRGLASLFTEYVQGTEDDMKRPRRRGGTGLGLSICSKQVSVLGGSLGAMSKLGEGSTFWFTIPLLRPTQSQPRESISMRRTASWGSRDAFSDGHISRHADDPVEAARCMSAPEHWPGRRAVAEEKQRLDMRTANSDNTSLQFQDLGQPTAQSPQHKSSNEASQQQSGSSPDTPNATARQKSQSGHEEQLHRQLNGHSHGKDGLQRNLLAPYEAARPAAATAVNHADRGGFGRGQSLEALPEGSSLVLQAPAAHQRPKDSQICVRQGKGGSVSSPSAPLNIRSSMEARRRRLGLSALQGRMVLLAEDNLINQRVAKMMLSSLGMTVEVVSNGQEAVDAVKRRVGRDGVRQFDVLLMDMAMPVMGGVDATKEIRRSGAVVPIVAMTANSSDKDRDECLESGMDGFLSKPVLKDRLAEAILTAVSGRRQFQDRGTISLKAYDQL
ncbi:hypothetical protein WJX82_011186 [Trebouxia sp. C0006]